MSAVANGTAPVAVLRDDREGGRWMVCCTVCRPGVLGNLSTFGFNAPASLSSGVAHSPQWDVAMTWANTHRRKHEDERCLSCCRMPESSQVSTHLLAQLAADEGAGKETRP